MDDLQLGEIAEGVRGLRRDMATLNTSMADFNKTQTSILLSMQDKTNRADCAIHAHTLAQTYVSKVEFEPYKNGARWALGMAAGGIVTGVGALCKMLIMGLPTIIK